MTERIKSICNELDKTKTLADIGCDHGYVTEYALKRSLCEKAIISDVSAESLSKAENLLKNYIQKGKCKSIICDGFDGFDCIPDFAVIAGMGGKEIISILNKSKLKPDKLLLQPMKNQKEVREYLISSGYKIIKDYTFFDDKYYDLIKAEKCDGTQEKYTETELLFGRDNIRQRNKAFISKVEKELQMLENLKRTERLSEESSKDIENRICQIKVALNVGSRKNL